jgi:hypothetical protein
MITKLLFLIVLAAISYAFARAAIVSLHAYKRLGDPRSDQMTFLKVRNPRLYSLMKYALPVVIVTTSFTSLSTALAFLYIVWGIAGT